MKIVLRKNADARTMLDDPAFGAQWQQLQAKCPWATAFQSRDFVRPWYHAYAERYAPLVVTGHSAMGELIGLLPLAIDSASDQIVPAGGRQAEYQGWLTTSSADTETFIEGAFQEIASASRVSMLSFRYLPPGIPVDRLLATDNSWVCEEETCPRPIVHVADAAKVASYIQQRSRIRNYRNRLARLGKLRFDRILDKDEMSRLFDDLAAFYDVRQCAAHDVLPFHDDPYKKAFHFALFGPADVLHLTVVRVDEEVISAMFGIADGRTFSLAMPMFSPWRTDFSPVNVHLLMLVEKLHQEGFSLLDLTPGVDTFKQRAASDHDSVRLLTICFRKSVRARRKVIRNTTQLAVSGLRRLRISPEAIRPVLSAIRRAGVRGLFPAIARAGKRALTRRWSSTETRIYRMPAKQAAALEGESRLTRDRLADLLDFRPRFGWQTTQRFLSESLDRMEQGHHFYTMVKDRVLLHYGWLADQQDRSTIPEVEQELLLPPGSAMLYDFYTDPSARGQGHYQSALRQLARDAAVTEGTEHVWISVQADNAPSRHAIEKVGFLYVGSLFLTRRLNQTVKRSTVPTLAGDRPQAVERVTKQLGEA